MLGNLHIYDNNALISIGGLDAFTSVELDIGINFNDTLTTLSGLDALTAVGGTLYIGTQFSFFGRPFSPNPKLADFCAIKQLITNGQITEIEYAVANNKYNPTFSQMQNNECSTLSIQEIGDAVFSMYPNPTDGIINIKNTEYYKMKKLSIFNISGKNIYQKEGESKFVDLTNFTKGIYFIKIETARGVSLQKIIKQ